MLWVWIGLAVLVGFTAAGYFVARFYMGAKENLDKPSREFIQLYRDGEYQRAYEEFGSTQLKKAVESEKFEESLQGMQNILGDLETYTPGKFFIRSSFGSDATGTMEYSAEFEKGNGLITMGLNKNDGKWKITAFRVNSPRFDEFVAEQSKNGGGTSKIPRAARKNAPDADTAARQFIRLYQRGEFAEAYSTSTSSRFKDEFPAEDFEAMATALAEKMGALKSFTLRETESESPDGATLLEYHAKFENDEGIIRVEIEEEEEGALRIRKFEIQDTAADPSASNAEVPAASSR